ncbi:ZFY16 protein, partial [Spelaeornis formosus]|nr:ZFY16 protein [Elachura formosa]
ADPVPTGLLQRHQWCSSSSTALPENRVLADSSGHTGAEEDSGKKGVEDNVGSEELNSSEIASRDSSLCMSAGDAQSSLSCLSLPATTCGSLAVTEEKANPLPQNAVAEVISDTVTAPAGQSETPLPDRQPCEDISGHEQEDLSEITESTAEKNSDTGKFRSDNGTDDSDSQQIKASTSAFLDLGAEPCGAGVEAVCGESIHSATDDFAVEENPLEVDILISDAELDDFLYGQSLQSSVLKPSDSGANFMEADGENLADLHNLDFTEVNEELMQAKVEEIGSINSNLEASIADAEREAAGEVSTSHAQGVTESGSGALDSHVCIKDARPKHLLDLPQGAAGQKQQNRTNDLEGENQESVSVTPGALLLDTSARVGSSSDAGDSSAAAAGSQTSEGTEPRAAPAALSWKQPLWVPDSEAPKCMSCQAKFTFTRRRHHCRACGKVFCGNCCKRKCKLQYMEKEARVCTGCYDDINKGKE